MDKGINGYGHGAALGLHNLLHTMPNIHKRVNLLRSPVSPTYHIRAFELSTVRLFAVRVQEQVVRERQSLIYGSAAVRLKPLAFMQVRIKASQLLSGS